MVEASGAEPAASDVHDWAAAIREVFRAPVTRESCDPMRYDAVPGKPIEVGDFRVYYDGSLLEGRDNFTVRVRFAGPSEAGRVLWDQLAAKAAREARY